MKISPRKKKQHAPDQPIRDQTRLIPMREITRRRVSHGDYYRDHWFRKEVHVFNDPEHEGHMASAFALLGLDPFEEAPNKRAPRWITVGVVISLRHSLRECDVNCWTVEPSDFIHGQGRFTRSAYRAWMSYARTRDRVHHGSPTF